MLKGHHKGYIDWAEFERNQKQLAINAYGKSGALNPNAAPGSVVRVDFLCPQRPPLIGKLRRSPTGRDRLSFYPSKPYAGFAAVSDLRCCAD